MINEPNKMLNLRRLIAAVAVAASLALVILFGVAGTANAELLEHNDGTLPDSADGNNLTVDTDTGLEWLDLDVLANRTFLDVFVNVLIDPAYAEFSIATTAQVDSLFDAFDIIGYNGLHNDYYYTYQNSVFADWEAALGLVSGYPVLGAWASIPIMAGYAYHNGDMYVPYLEFHTSIATLRVGGTPDGDGWELSSHTARNDVGTWLVRASTIPEPSTLSLAIALLLGIAIRRRRRAEILSPVGYGH